jgi:hypothetical protein
MDKVCLLLMYKIMVNNMFYHILTYDMYDFACAIQMAMVSLYHSPCNNNDVQYGGVIRHYYYMGCDMAKTKWRL